MPFTIYYLDDEPDLLEIFAETFSSKKILIRTFISPDEAIAEAAVNPPDLMFIDFRLSGTTGFEVAKRLLPSIPKALISGDMSIQSDRLFLKAFEKPVDKSLIEEFIQSQMAQRTT